MTKYVIFDMDGTILNTLEDLCDSVNHVLKEHSMEERSLEEIRSFVGNGIEKLILRSVPSGTPKEESDRCFTDMIAYYREHSMIKTRPYDGIDVLIKNIREKGVGTAVVTNKEYNAAKALCDDMFSGLFDAVVGDDGKMPLKPDPAGVLRAMSQIGAKREETLFVGDSDVDINTAVNAGIKSVGVLWGFRDKKTLIRSGADIIARDMRELEDIILNR